jgi:hypothetical protein
LPTGTSAVCDRDTKSVTCMACLAEQIPVASQTTRPDFPESFDDAKSALLQLGPEQSEVFAGVAGASAQRKYERLKNKRETQIRDAHPCMGGLILALSDDPQSTRAWATGAQGEKRLGRQLDSLVGDGVHVLHDRRIPPTKANIDHIVVCPSGVYVIDAKKYQGQRPSLRIEGGGFRARTETLIVGSRNGTKLVNGVHKQVTLNCGIRCQCYPPWRRSVDHTVRTGNVKLWQTARQTRTAQTGSGAFAPAPSTQATFRMR